MASEEVPDRASVEVVAQQLGSCRVAQLGHGLRLDLPDALPGHPVDLADLVEGLGLAVGQPEPHRDHPGLPFGQGVQHRVQLLLQQRELTASPGWIASESSIRSPNSLSPSSPSGVCSEIGSRPYFCTSMTFSGVMSSSAASSSGVGSRPRSCSICRWTRASLLMTSTMCTGIRMVRA